MLQRVLDCLEVRKLAPHYLGKLLQLIQQALEVKLTNYLIFKMQVLHDSICISILSLFQGMHFCLCTFMTGVNPQRSWKSTSLCLLENIAIDLCHLSLVANNITTRLTSHLTQLITTLHLTLMSAT